MQSDTNDTLQAWQSDPARGLSRQFKLPSFAAAQRFINRMADMAEHMDHHPQITWRYRQVTVNWFSWDQKRITERDYQAARQCEQILTELDLEH